MGHHPRSKRQSHHHRLQQGGLRFRLALPLHSGRHPPRRVELEPGGARQIRHARRRSSQPRERRHLRHRSHHQRGPTLQFNLAVSRANGEKTGTAPGEFSGPTGIAIDADGYVYIVDTGNNRIQKFDANGVFLDQWGGVGSGNGQFQQPAGIAVRGERIYVSDYGNDRRSRSSTGTAAISASGAPPARPGRTGRSGGSGGLARRDTFSSSTLATTGSRSSSSMATF
ncbi:MAG: hypothetical protein R2849_09645 [Thermomicrobiales bacterium]